MAERIKNYSKSAHRALDVMGWFAATGAPARAADIADALGLARSSADQLLKTMALSGYLVISPLSKTYFPSQRMAPFGDWITRRYPFARAYREILEGLYRATGEIVTLTMQNDCFMQMLDAVGGAKDDPRLGIGARIPVVGSAVGGAALAALPVAQVRKLLARASRRRVSLAAGPISSLDQVQLFRMKGYAWSGPRRDAVGEGRHASELWSIAMSLPGEEGDSVVLGLAGAVSRVRPREQDHVNLMRRLICEHLGDTRAIMHN